MLKKLLVPVDGSDRALKVLPRALAWAETVVLLNVQPPADTPTLLLHMTQDAIDHAQIDQGRRVLEAARATLPPQAPVHLAPVRLGDPASLIASTAQDEGVDAIMMATHGRGALASLAMGSTATRVVHLASVPVVLVR